MEYDINKLADDRNLFDNFIYTSLNEAVEEIKKRRGVEDLEKKVFELLNGNMPRPLFDGQPRGVLFRSILTPNYEVVRFVNILDSIQYLKPLFFEYTGDKFTSNNLLKHSLGKMGFYSGRNKNNDSIIEFVSIVDFNKYNGKIISDIKTLWGQSLVEFHHRMFDSVCGKVSRDFFYDISSWFKLHGPTARDYYRSLMLLCCRDVILFENFMLEDAEEKLFTREVVLPAFLDVWKMTGVRPLIVALEPTNIEGDHFWSCYPYEYLDIVKKHKN